MAKEADRIAVACVQPRISLQDYLSESSFASLVSRLMNEATRSMPEGVPRLVAFPEDFASGLIFAGEESAVGDARTLRGAVASLVRRHFAGVMGQRLRHRVGWTRALALYRAADVAGTYMRVFSEAARVHRAYVVAGSALLPRMDPDGKPQGSEVFNVSYLFDPAGRVVGAQRKAFLIDMESSENLDLVPAPVEELAAWDTELGRLGVAICFDAFQQPVIERMDSLNVDILVQPSANPGPWTREQQEDWLNGIWTAVCQRGIARYGINPMLVGRLLDVEFAGQSAIVCRPSDAGEDTPRGGYAALPPRPGFVQVARGDAGEEVLVATLPHPRT
ncbi:MAG: carbon-nitrogen hydrolase family protein [Firmicutes bacterium]|nr:carbon-nitrogen hydrolase family protein [Bacillota bacterium]